jgi:hypothetical protein
VSVERAHTWVCPSCNYVWIAAVGYILHRCSSCGFNGMNAESRRKYARKRELLAELQGRLVEKGKVMA